MSCFVLSILLAWSILQMHLTQCQRVIYVTKNHTAINTTLCWAGGNSIPCNNLTLALGGAYVYNDTTVRIDSLYSPYQLDASPFNTFENIHYLRLESYGKNQVEIHCSSGAGLSFVSVSDISIVNVGFIGCGVKHNSTSNNFTDSSSNDAFLTYSVALYFVSCTNVTMDEVTVSQSIGVAIQFYAARGTNSITSSRVVNNNSPMGVNGVGGALYIEYPYCLPDRGKNCSQKDPSTLVRYSYFTIKDCVFLNNNASIGAVVIPSHISRNKNNSQFGNGGGISVSFKGSSNSNKVLIVNCSFSSNTAVRGGGVYIDFQDDVVANNVTIINSFADDCTAISGGAIAIFYYNFDSVLFEKNIVSINSTNFTNNTAKFWGGAVSMYVTRKTDSTNQLTLTNCNLVFNTGSFGSAVSFSLWSSSSKGPGNPLVPVVDSCRFADNIDTKVGDSQELAQFGALYLYFVSVLFVNKVEFHSNLGSGIVAVSAELRFAEATDSLFINNTAIHGAGISLLGNAVMTLSRNTSYMFLDNAASLFGGAIYSSTVGERTALSQNCFMQYKDHYTPPKDWIVQFTFTNNTVDGTNSTAGTDSSLSNTSGNSRKLNAIYAQSILPCLGMTAHQDFSFDLTTKREVFCWNETMWQYSSPECWQEIQTAAAELFVSSSVLHIKPGINTYLNITAFDDLHNNVTDYLVLFAQSTTSNIAIDHRSHYISSNTIKLHPINNYTGNNTYSIHLQTLPSRVLETQLDVFFIECTEGLELTDGKCAFSGTYRNYLRYNSTSGLAEIFREYWFGIREDGTKIVAYCLFCNGFSNRNSSIGGYVPLNFTTTKNVACSDGRRKGFLCSECQGNLSMAIFSVDKQCKDTNSMYNVLVWMTYVVSHMVYYFLLALFIILTNISFTAAPLNSAIIFAQMVTTVVDVNAGGIINLSGLKTIVKVYTCLYDLFNLNLFHPLFHHLTISLPLPIAKLLLGCLPLLSLVAVLFTWILISCLLCISNNNCKSLFYCKEMKPNNPLVVFCNKFKVTEKMRNTLGSFLLLSSTSLLIILFQLINPTFLYSSDNTIVGSVFFLDPGTQYSLGHFYCWGPILAIFVILIPFLGCISCFRYRDNLNEKKCPIFDHILQPLQCHFKRYEPKTCCEICIKKNENHENRENQENAEEKRLHEECPYRLSCGCLRCPPCCDGLVFISFQDFHWVPAGFIILRIILIVMYNYAWDFIIRCTMQLVTVVAVAAFMAIYRPYKSEWINALDTFIFLDLALLIALSGYQYHLTEVISDLSVWVYVIQLVLIFLPFIWIALYIGVRLYRRCCICKQNVNEGQPLFNNSL